MNLQVGIIMGSDSDLLVMSEAAKILDELEVSYELTIVSAHRTPDRLVEYSKMAKSRGIKVIIAGAGGAAHLPGMVAAMTILPVIGVPIRGRTLQGLDSLYSIVSMPPGIPVATMAINGACNAGLLAVKILAVFDEELAKRLERYTERLKTVVEEKARRLESIKYEAYLEQQMEGR